MKKIAINTLVNTLLIAVIGIGIHTLFHDWFYSPQITGDVWRPAGPLRSYVIPGSLLMGFAIATLYSYWKRTTSWVSDGLRYGLVMFAFAFGLGVLVTYGSSQIQSPLWILAEGGFVLFYALLTGLASARIQRAPSPA